MDDPTLIWGAKRVSESDLKRTCLHSLHLELGAKMVAFAGYEMPVQYGLGVMKEHQHTRALAGLFDVSHMGQVLLRGTSYEAAALGLERLIPMDVLGLGTARQRYGFFTNDAGGIEDDLMFANRGDHIFVVVNAACKAADISRLTAALEPGINVEPVTDRALLALQGPAAEEVLAEINPAAADMRFMDVTSLDLGGTEAWVSRSGYTGEDGYEISVPVKAAEALARALLGHAAVEPIGLGARDSLRLEAGLCLYGSDIDAETSPGEASLNWAIQTSRRSGGARAGGFPGAARILGELDGATSRKRVGLKPDGRAPMRAGVTLFTDPEGGEPIGEITSGCFGPSLGAPVAMGYVPIAQSERGTRLYGELRGKRQPVSVASLPFTPANFKR